jgi:putative ABC transport system permease protein
VYSTVIGWPAKDADKRFADYDIGLEQGNFFRESQKYNAVIGHDVAYNDDTFFKKELKIGQKILIGEKKFKVGGIIERIGNPEDDSVIYIPIETARELFNKPKEVSFIDTTVKPGKDLALVSERIQKDLERHRRVDDFDVMTPDQVLKIFSAILGIVQAVLIGIAGISLLVGCVGIMNSMFTNVLERTKEIGVMKSIGAENKQIMILFMIEAGLIGLVGGIAGTILGSLVGFGVEAAAQAAGFELLKIQLHASMIISVLFFSMIIGVVAGYLPARRAAQLHPVDALRWIK